MSEDNTRLDQYLKELAEARSEAKRHRLAKRKAEEELVTLKNELEGFKKEPHTLKEENDRLRGELRNRDHKASFHKLAKGLNVREDALDDLWKLTGYVPDTDLPDERTITGLINEAVKARPYLVVETKTEPPKTLAPGPGLSRGTSEGVVGFVVTKENLQDPTWAMNNAKRIADHGKAGDLLWRE